MGEGKAFGRGGAVLAGLLLGLAAGRDGELDVDKGFEVVPDAAAAAAASRLLFSDARLPARSFSSWGWEVRRDSCDSGSAY